MGSAASNQKSDPAGRGLYRCRAVPWSSIGRILSTSTCCRQRRTCRLTYHANAGISHLLSSRSTTDSERQAYWTNVKEKTHNGETSLGLLLKHEKSDCSTELLLVIKKISAEVGLPARFPKKNQIIKLNLELARVARKE